MTDFEQVREDVAVCSRAALTPASAAASHRRAAEGTPGAHAPLSPRGQNLNWWDDTRDFRGCLLWMIDTGRINCCFSGEYHETPEAFTEEFVEWQAAGKPRRPLR